MCLLGGGEQTDEGKQGEERQCRCREAWTEMPYTQY